MAINPKLKLLIIIATVSGLALLYFFVDARYTNFFPHCPFNSLTGLYCPGCGSQRALSSLLHADVAEALRFNVLMVASLPVLLYAAWANIYNVFSKQKMQRKIFYSPRFTKAVLVIVLAFWLCRNIPFSPFTWLAPKGKIAVNFSSFSR